MSSYVHSTLMPGEKIRYQTSLSIWSLIPGLIAGAILLLFSVVSIGFLPKEIDPAISLMMSGAFAVFGIIMLLAQVSRFYTTEIAFTDKRFIYKKGLIRRDVIDMVLEKIESVQINISVFGRMFNFGDVTIAAAGEDNAIIKSVASPVTLREAYQMSYAENKNRLLQGHTQTEHS
ncbi:PH domain-containing protein [Maritalea sp.]|uniref:PH domain-containing protein n=1 Tax=Maritalea sp. TaxID=2003361 RepID=UPI003EF148D7